MNLVWLRNDLRIEDNPALHHAAQQNDVCCVYVVTPKQWQQHQDAPSKIAFWRQRLIALQSDLNALNIPLKIISASDYSDIPQKMLALAEHLSINSLFFNEEYPLNEKMRDDDVTNILQQHSYKVCRYHGDVIMPPGTVKTQQDATYKVFTPFSRQWHKCAGDQALNTVAAPKQQAASYLSLQDDIEQCWTPSLQNHRHDLWPVDSDAIHQRMTTFCVNKSSRYKEYRDFPSIHGTSTLSPYLTCGAISARQCIAVMRQHNEDWRSNQWVTEIIWREFYRHLLCAYPHLSRSENFIATKHPIPWNNDEAQFNAWCEGRTGYPIVDAAMKQLVQTGWMHNRLRMITAAFLTKLLLVDWRKGEAFFMLHLLDGDYASNNGGWQWAASTGADAAPYFRIFSPERQSERFDKEGKFIKKLLPELSTLHAKNIHTPSESDRLSCQYPAPIVDYKMARQRALEEYATAMGKEKKIEKD
ncbi:deoxyribodipyrimidine photo-lyase [Eionea flava]